MRTTRRVSATSPVFILFALILLAPLASADSLRVGYFDLPPHTPLPGQADTEGTAIAYFAKIAERVSGPNSAFDLTVHLVRSGYD